MAQDVPRRPQAFPTNPSATTLLSPRYSPCLTLVHVRKEDDQEDQETDNGDDEVELDSYQETTESESDSSSSSSSSTGVTSSTSGEEASEDDEIPSALSAPSPSVRAPTRSNAVRLNQRVAMIRTATLSVAPSILLVGLSAQEQVWIQCWPSLIRRSKRNPAAGC